jgi:hypothetical protein
MANSTDFRADQVQTSKIIVTGSNPQKTLLIYGIDADDSPANQGNIDPAVFNTSSIGSDVFLFVSGTVGGRGGVVPSIVAFGGDLHVSGNLTIDGTYPSGGGGGTNFFTEIALDSIETTGSVAMTFLSASTGAEITGSLSNGYNVSAAGTYSHAEGLSATAAGFYSHAEGWQTYASALASHAEGYFSVADGEYSHATGYGTRASGTGSFAAGLGTRASGSIDGGTPATTQAALGKYNIENNTDSLFVVGDGLDASNRHDVLRVNSGSVQVTGSFEVLGGITGSISGTVAGNNPFIIAGSNITANYNSLGQWEITGSGGGGTNFFTEIALDSIETTGSVAMTFLSASTGAAITGSITQGAGNTASGASSFARGNTTVASGQYAFSEGYGGCLASGDYSHAQGYSSTASGQASHSEGIGGTASGLYSHIEGGYTQAQQDGSHAEGYYANANAIYSHAEGVYTVTTGPYSHAEGGYSNASGTAAHAEGNGTAAVGNYSHSEGGSTIASGQYSHAEGIGTNAFGTGSLAVGLGTVASGAVDGGAIQTTIQAAFGKYNLENNTDSLFVVGDGLNSSNRHDVLRVNSGSVEVTGSLEVLGGITGSLSGTVAGNPFIVAGSNITASYNSLGQWDISTTSPPAGLDGSLKIPSDASWTVVGTGTATATSGELNLSCASAFPSGAIAMLTTAPTSPHFYAIELLARIQSNSLSTGGSGYALSLGFTTSAQNRGYRIRLDQAGNISDRVNTAGTWNFTGSSYSPGLSWSTGTTWLRMIVTNGYIQLYYGTGVGTTIPTSWSLAHLVATPDTTLIRNGTLDRLELLLEHFNATTGTLDIDVFPFTRSLITNPT